MKGFILGIGTAVLVWAAGWDNVALVLDTADAYARQAIAATERHLGDARARRATTHGGNHETQSTGR